MQSSPDIYGIMMNTVMSFVNSVFSFFPRLIGSAVVLILGFGLARLFSRLALRVLSRIGLDKLGERLNEVQFIRQLQTEIKLSEVISKIIYYFVLLIFITASTETLGVEAISKMIQSLVAFIPRLIAAAIMLQIGIMVADALKKAVTTLAASFNIPSARNLGTVVFAFVLLVVIISALSQAGINTTLLESSFNLLIGGAIFAFALGYGLSSKEIMVNTLSSIYSRSQFEIGQRIRIDDIEGTITSINQSTILLQTGKDITRIPMSTLQNKIVVYLGAAEPEEQEAPQPHFQPDGIDSHP
ncbi:mechanosensitive ion channel family protein [Arsenicibacter rosenii]|uniref:Mechanosensitive ion channel MscS domain-containing protein n=1 Tax=Arsenicibacter rosenii TaxID=1750698 RepID=A0A1S2VT96_9BACT|nr:mechanosensitive ion channel domain-containing protein [Arsenicibacter rosenii]OIN61138.1 hypothetical protein BLX24_03495 [Arsenicibacter rosenii]